jgi:hypothetical protein
MCTLELGEEFGSHLRFTTFIFGRIRRCQIDNRPISWGNFSKIPGIRNFRWLSLSVFHAVTIQSVTLCSALIVLLRGFEPMTVDGAQTRIIVLIWMLHFLKLKFCKVVLTSAVR